MTVSRLFCASALVFSLALCPVTSFAKNKDKEKDKTKEESTDKSSGKESTVTSIENCPQAVQATIRGFGGELKEVELEKQKDGQVSYDAKITLPDGKRLKVQIAPDGKVLDTKEKKAKE